MDLKQTKLSKTEWNNTEVPVEKSESFILSVVNDGFDNINICKNINKSLFDMLKIDISKENEDYLYLKYFDKNIQETLKKYNIGLTYDTSKINKNNKKNEKS